MIRKKPNVSLNDDSYSVGAEYRPFSRFLKNGVCCFLRLKPGRSDLRASSESVRRKKTLAGVRTNGASTNLAVTSELAKTGCQCLVEHSVALLNAAVFPQQKLVYCVTSNWYGSTLRWDSEKFFFANDQAFCSKTPPNFGPGFLSTVNVGLKHFCWRNATFLSRKWNVLLKVIRSVHNTVFQLSLLVEVACVGVNWVFGRFHTQ